MRAARRHTAACKKGSAKHALFGFFLPQDQFGAALLGDNALLENDVGVEGALARHHDGVGLLGTLIERKALDLLHLGIGVGRDAVSRKRGVQSTPLVGG